MYVPLKTGRIRAVFRQGVFQPLEPTGLPEGIEVVMDAESVSEHPDQIPTETNSRIDDRLQSHPMWIALQKIWKEQDACGYKPPSAAEADAEIAAIRSE